MKRIALALLLSAAGSCGPSGDQVADPRDVEKVARLNNAIEAAAGNHSVAAEKSRIFPYRQPEQGVVTVPAERNQD